MYQPAFLHFTCLRVHSQPGVLCPSAALLERQMVVFCPNIGILSAVVLSLIPLMRPFAWQSLLLPILPVQDKMLDILEAPVPFILGVKVLFLKTLLSTRLC